MLYKSALTTQASGSIDGMTASHNRFGRYMRARAIPVDPNTPAQVSVRTIFAGLVNHWINTLTQVQRDQWILYGQNVPIINVLGDPIILTGLNQYVRSNTARLQGALARIDDGPIVFDTGEFTPLTMTAADTLDLMTFNFDNTDAWANEDGATLLVRTSTQRNDTVNFFKGPFLFRTEVLGDAITPPTSPLIVANQGTIDAGNRVWASVRVSSADGRLSVAQVLDTIIA